MDGRFRAILIVALLSGCVAPSGDALLAPPGPAGTAEALPPEMPDGPAEAREGTAIAWALTECRVLSVDVRFDPEGFADLLPPGFRFLTGPTVPVTAPRPEPLERAFLGLRAFDCAAGTGLSGTVAPIPYAAVFIDVAPPAELRRADAAHFLVHTVLVPDADRRELLKGLGVDAVDGRVVLTEGPSGRSAVVALEGVGEIRITSAHVGHEGGMEGAAFRDLVPASDGFVFWDGLVDSSDSFTGRGVLEVPAGSIFARVGGGTTIPVEVWGGTFTVREGTISTAIAE